MIVVTGHLLVAAGERTDYLAGCDEVMRRAKEAPGCLDFWLVADPHDPARIDVLERWESAEAAEAFRGSGPSDEQQGQITGGHIEQYEVASSTRLL